MLRCVSLLMLMQHYSRVVETQFRHGVALSYQRQQCFQHRMNSLPYAGSDHSAMRRLLVHFTLREYNSHRLPVRHKCRPRCSFAGTPQGNSITQGHHVNPQQPPAMGMVRPASNRNSSWFRHTVTGLNLSSSLDALERLAPSPADGVPALKKKQSVSAGLKLP